MLFKYKDTIFEDLLAWALVVCPKILTAFENAWLTWILKK
jgi:hypothetical protein